MFQCLPMVSSKTPDCQMIPAVARRSYTLLQQHFTYMSFNSGACPSRQSRSARANNQPTATTARRRPTSERDRAQYHAVYPDRSLDLRAMEEACPGDSNALTSTTVYVYRRDGDWVQTTDSKWHRRPRPWHKKLTDPGWSCIESVWPDTRLRHHYDELQESACLLYRRAASLPKRKRICLTALLCLSVAGLSVCSMTQGPSESASNSVICSDSNDRCV